ncbi:MAG: hypothetical protein AAF039_03805 [Bacteroidota bacterium]
MKIKILPAVIMVSLWLGTSTVMGQDQPQGTAQNGKEVRLGVSAQFYPAGFIPTLMVEPFLNEDWSLLFRVGANITDRQDFSDFNDSEEGEGFGGSIGVRKHFPLKKGKITAGFITDLWALEIDWTDADALPTSGTTDVLVLQPYLEAGYFFPFKNSSSQLGATIGFGREINIDTSGEEVEADFILSIALQYSFGL